MRKLLLHRYNTLGNVSPVQEPICMQHSTGKRTSVQWMAAFIHLSALILLSCQCLYITRPFTSSQPIISKRAALLCFYLAIFLHVWISEYLDLETLEYSHLEPHYTTGDIHITSQRLGEAKSLNRIQNQGKQLGVFMFIIKSTTPAERNSNPGYCSWTNICWNRNHQ